MGKFEYAPAPESRDVVALRESYGLFIDGDFVPGKGDGVFKTISPATEEVLAEVTEASPADVDRAVSAARRAYERTWSVMPGRERAKYLFRIARIIQERARELAVLESLDNGKPIRESRDVDIPLAAAHFFYYAGWADKLEHAGFGPDPRPLGVAGQVIPWNFPLLMLAWKIAPALACGNTVVLKPAETTPLTALLFAEICQQADLPPGVVNIVTGAGATGRALVTHPGIDKVAFTGSTEVGKEIARAAGRKKVTLELGGKAANIVFADAPVDQAVEGIVNGIFFNQGHVCCAGSRLLIQESIYDQVLESLRRRLATLRLGDPLDKNTDVGAINSPAQLAKIRELSDSGEAEGAERWSAPCELPVKGFWFPPTVFTGVSPAIASPARRSSDRCCRCSPSGPRPKRSRRPTTPPTGCPPASGPTRAHGSCGWPRGCGPGWCGPTPSTNSTPPRRSAATRSPATAARAAATAWRPTSMSETVPASRVAVRKTYKLYIGGAFPRSESGRSYAVTDHKDNFLANAAMASRKDAEDAVTAARKAVAGWSGATAYNRGQVLYRVAELLRDAGPSSPPRCARLRVRGKGGRGVVDAAIDRWVWYAGGPTRSRRSEGPPTRSRGRTTTSRWPRPPASPRCSHRRAPACSVSSRWWRPPWSAATP